VFTKELSLLGLIICSPVDKNVEIFCFEFQENCSTANGITTTFALDIQGLPEVIYTSDGETFIHLPGVIVTENASGNIRYLLSDTRSGHRRTRFRAAGRGRNRCSMYYTIILCKKSEFLFS